MPLGYTTIITSILPGRAKDLKDYLRKEVRPQFNPNNPVKIIKCQDSFPFDQIKGLHLCSMVILHGVAQSDPPCLVFEATFDGSREEFLEDLLRVALEGIDVIYKNCADYPASGLEIPELIKEYLITHDVGAQTFYSGSPGRSVPQINGEREVHEKIVHHVCERRLKKDAPTTFLGLQRELQREVIRKQPDNHHYGPDLRWAEQPAVVPWEVARRKLVAAVVVLASLITACVVGKLALRLGGLRFADVQQWIGSQGGNITSAQSFLSLEPVFFRQVPNPIWLFLLLIGWLLLRIFELFLEEEDPRKHHFFARYAVYGCVILRYALLVLVIGFALLALPTLGPPPPLRVSLEQLGAAALIWLLLRYWATSLKLVIEFRELTRFWENLRRLGFDVVRFLMVVVAAWAFLIVGRQLPGIRGALDTVVPFFKVLLVLTIYVLIGVLAAYALGFIVFCLVRGLEIADRRQFAPATELIAKGLDASVYEREEGGVNRYQNHLASLTYVKPGILRVGLLRLTLFAIGLLARFWFNQGELGGIPTILAARWVLIDGGRRLLFFTNYGGGWDSYLDEFIDMGAVKGLNAIWSNTFIKTANSKLGYAFPKTSYYLWEGAQAEQPFKAYVRHSQVETLVWYSAYPTLSIKNVNANTELRQALFKSLAACELDSVFLGAGL